jgi:hypothetical protein
VKAAVLNQIRDDTVARAVINTVRAQPGSTVVAIGCGGVGISVIQGARLSGVTPIGAADAVTEKHALAQRFGVRAVWPTELCRSQGRDLRGYRLHGPSPGRLEGPSHGDRPAGADRNDHAGLRVRGDRCGRSTVRRPRRAVRHLSSLARGGLV